MEVERAQQYVVSGNEGIRFKLVRDLKEIEEEGGYFHPDMCHQVFGENESIFGYKNLKINIMFNANSFLCYISSSYDSVIESEAEPQNYMEKLNKWLPNNYTTSVHNFVKQIEHGTKVRPFGEKIYSFNNDEKVTNYEIYVCNNKEPHYADFHHRMETLIVWYIDAANLIDTDDEKWRFFVLYEKCTSGEHEIHFPVGYTTVYEYFAYPDSRRYRISQFIIFPPYQNMGLGTELLKAVNSHLGSLTNIFDITVEDPSEKFQLIRDFLDVKSCLTLPSFSPQMIKGDFSKVLIDDARNHFKINEKQCRRVYEILRLYHTDVDDPSEFNKFKTMIIRRLTAPFRRQHNNKRLNKVFKDTNYTHFDHQLRIMEKDSQILINQYRHVISRVFKANV